MFIHFAFGTLAKQGNIDEQIENFIKFILIEKKLKLSKCTEFIPAFPIPGAKRIPMEMFKAERTSTGVAAKAPLDLKKIQELPDDTEIHYLQQAIPMVSFINIPFNELRTSPHFKEYGKLGC